MSNINASPRVDLRDITICAVDSLNPELAARAIDWSCKYCDFGDAILFTHEPVHTQARIVRTHRIESQEDYSTFVYQNAIEHIRTPFALVVQWDGFVADARAWQSDFLDYDYIGARWPFLPEGESVGNGGFSLRSVKLMRLLASGQYPLSYDLPEDIAIARKYRRSLETEHGIRFAPEAVADRFAHEASIDPGATFGFHGAHNLFRYLGPQQLSEFAEIAHSSTMASQRVAGLLGNCFFADQDWALRLLYTRLRNEGLIDRVRATLHEAGMNAQAIDDCMRRCEMLVSPAAGH